VAVRPCALENMDLSGCFGGSFAGLRVLVTGHTGFKGSWLATWLQALGAQVSGIALDPETEPAHWSLLGLRLAHDLRCDVRDADALRAAVRTCAPDVVFHLAAQALVRVGYRDPVGTFASNVIGTVHLLDALRAVGGVRAAVIATTDKVYRNDGGARPFGEDDPLGAHDPYAASKACAELVVECYRNAGLAGAGTMLATGRAGNVIGGGDWAEDRLVPDAWRAVERGEPLVLRNPEATRPWQHVLEPLSGYLHLARALLAGEPVATAWNFGPAEDDELSVRWVVDELAREWPALAVRVDRGPHPPEAERLRLDARRARERLSWHGVWHAREAVSRTAAWYEAWRRGRVVSTRDDIARYCRDARAAGLPWAA